jgi:integrase
MKQLNNTKVTVRIRKAAFREEWYLCIESYPVFVQGSKKPQRIVEALNRTITSIIWDKKRTARTTETSKTFKPKRDENGVIMCKTEKDQQACLYADGVRKLRQREYDNADLYSDTETAQAEQKERSQQNFIEYFNATIKKRHARSSESIRTNWKRTLDFLTQFAGEMLTFKQINNPFAEDFKLFLFSAPCGGNKVGTIAHNTAATYFSIFKAALKQAFVDGYLTIDLSAKIKGIQDQETRREFLTVEELNILAGTPCDHDQMKRAALFSALTGLRHCDIQKMQWKELQIDGTQARLNFTQQKTKGVEYMPISPQALELCGEPRNPNQLVFEDLPDPAWISRPLKKWLETAGITKKITFHCFRHTFATLQLSNGTDIYTVSKMLGHTNVKTTQIYAKVVDKKKEQAANAIKLNLIAK